MVGGITRPSPGGDRPGISRPELSRPELSRPELGRPEFSRPEFSRPGTGVADRPGLGKIDRPTIQPGGRPGIADGKPGLGDRPGIGRPGNKPLPGDRPIIGGGNQIGGGRPGDRPIIGGGNQIGGGNWFGNNINININNNNNINRPGWGIAGPSWQNQWSQRHIHHHHHVWYHGCWSSHWGNRWYMPVALGATFWGLTALSQSWGFGYYSGFVNPYLPTTVVAVAPAFDYSQPLVINNYFPAESSAAPASPPAAGESSDEQAGYKLLDRGRDAFQQGEYQTALNLAEQAIQKVPGDPVLHEFAALCFFALGRYQDSALVLNALLAVAPGMDWTTMIGLYRSSDEYTKQLRALETHVKQHSEDASALFVLAYHYLICGHTDETVKLLQRVIVAQPDDQVTRWLLDALTAEEETVAEADATPPAREAPAETAAAAAAAEAKPAVEPRGDEGAGQAEPSTDLIGRWQAERDGNKFELTIGLEGTFTWTYLPRDQEPSTIAGQYGVTGNALVMDGGDQGTLAGRVTSSGPDQFQLTLVGSPPGDTGLTFQRVHGDSQTLRP